MPPTLKKLREHIGFRCLCVHPFIGFSYMNSSWKNSRHIFLFLSKLSPFLELCPFEKIRMKSDACHILWTMHARVLKFHIWIPHGKIADPYFFLVRVMPLWKNQNETLLCPQLRRSWWGILVPGCACVHPSVCSSRTMHARILKFHTWIPHGKIFDAHFISCQSNLPFWSYAPLNKVRMKSDACHILWTMHARVWNFWLFKICQQDISKIVKLGDWNLVSW